MTDKELKDIVANLAVSQAETAEQMKKTDERLERQITRLGKQIGGLGEKFGGFTEGMAFPSMKKILEERFKMSVISANVRSRQNGREMEIDVLAYSNTDVNEVYIVEVKSHLRKEGLEQILKDLNNFYDFFPGHREKKLYGILAVVDSPASLEREIIRKGLYLAKIHDETFDIQVPEGFKPKSYGK